MNDQDVYEMTHESDPDLYSHSHDCGCPMCSGEPPDDYQEEDAKAPGRPTLYGEKMRQTAFFLPESMIAWLKDMSDSTGESMSEIVRRQIKGAMDFYNEPGE